MVHARRVPSVGLRSCWKSGECESCGPNWCCDWGTNLNFAARICGVPSTPITWGSSSQRQPGLVAVGMCIPTGRINPEQLEELARLAEEYGSNEIRFTIGQNAIIPNVPNDRVDDLLGEPLLKQFSSRPSPFARGLVACVGTDYCNLALIETKGRAVALSDALKEKLGSHGNPLTIHWSGCPAGCGNHQAADIGFRGFKTKIDGKIVDAVAIYAGGRTGQQAAAGREIMECVPCDENLPEW